MVCSSYLRNTVRFVNGDKTDASLHVLHALNKSFIVETLRGAVDDLQITSGQLLVDFL